MYTLRTLCLACHMYALWADFLLSLSGRQEGEKPRMHKRFSSLKIDTCNFLKTCDMLTVIIKTTGKEILLFQKCFLEYRYRANMYALQLYIYFCEPISSNRVDMYNSRTFFTCSIVKNKTAAHSWTCFTKTISFWTVATRLFKTATAKR